MFLLSLNLFKKGPKVILLFLFTFFMPLSLLLNVNTVVMAFLVIIFIYDVCFGEKITIGNNWFLILYFLILCLSILYSQDFKFGLKTALKSLPFLLLPIGLATTKCITDKQLKALAIALYLGNMLTLLISFIYAISVYKVNPLPLKDGFSYFTKFVDIHPSYYSIYLLFSTTLILWCYRKSKKLSTLVKIVLFLLLIIIQLYLKSRAGLISTVLVFIIYGFFNFRKMLIYFLVFVLILFFIVNKLVSQDFLNRNTSGSVEDRISIWLSAKDVISNNFFIGVGIGDYQLELDRQYYLNLFNHGINDKLNCHNQFLQTFVSGGVVAFASLIVIFVLLFKKFIKNRADIILYFVIPILVLMFFDSVLVRQHGILFFSFFTTILLKYKPE